MIEKDEIHIRYSCRRAHDSGETRHPQEVMKALGVEYEKAVPQSVADQWWFLHCSHIPPKAYLSVLGNGVDIDYWMNDK